MSARGLILVAEDEPAIADVIRRNLTSAGYSFTIQVLNYAAGPPVTFSTTNPESGLQQIVLTVGGPNGSSEQLLFLKEQP